MKKTRAVFHIEDFKKEFQLEGINSKGKISLKEILAYIVATDTTNYDNIFSSRRRYTPKFEDILREHLDAESLLKIEEIREDLEYLFQKDQLIYALPILKKIMEEYAGNIDFKFKEPVRITESNKITIPKFGEVEIELSHLTKSVYILFCQNPLGIDVRELWKYESQLRDIYLEVSNQLNYDAMNQSIKELIAQDSKAIYIHISRIKSAFNKLMGNYAKHYIITGERHGSSLKYIPIIRLNDDGANKIIEDMWI